MFPSTPVGFGSNLRFLFRTSTQSNFTAFRHEMEYCRMHASKSSLGNDIAKSYIASLAQEYSGEFITPTFYYCFTFFL
ncbi:hypothetical protein HanRHA438_Chr13g0600041 [Helianthus annuus]|nr:hypothetical protein HanRHA438_Chr13g0600041 [Helianthus annuus]